MLASIGTHSMAAKSAVSADCSLARAPCQSSARVTGEHDRGVVPLLNWSQRASRALSRARDTSMRMSESIKIEIKKRFSADVSLSEVYAHRSMCQANLGGVSEVQPAPP